MKKTREQKYREAVDRNLRKFETRAANGELYSPGILNTVYWVAKCCGIKPNDRSYDRRISDLLRKAGYYNGDERH